MRNRAEVRVGRLLEVRAEAGYRTQADVADIFAQIGEQTAKLEVAQVVIVVDWRRCPIMAPDASDMLLQAMKRNNARVERCAALAAQNSPVAVLQFLRLVRAADNASRRLFEVTEEAVSWLTEILTAAESARLRQFVAEPAAADAVVHSIRATPTLDTKK